MGLLYVLLCSGLLSVLFVVVFYLGCMILSFLDEEVDKVSPFECGFDGSGAVCVSYSIHFFIMMLMFIFFDLEVVMFLSVIVSSYSSMISYLVLLVFVVLGFYMEWWYGKLVWLV
uniref:NADH-ubiquinone oxidoreductase chain 3 n=1 Tax=Clavinema parasiluri TaxID=332280 RepID=A0A9F2HGX6_9BILA|nr:NADH dehydrogenase subunit 3 [Clavinema parasiluri]WAX01693.1 NADH dehydrogenase subunit 3 [Clavinema parasiluri]